jgi:C-terminal processing protease CtpA/Prc
VGSIALGLKVGDELIAVNGLPFDGTTQDLRDRFVRGTPTIALTFLRDERKFVVLSNTPNLGQWKEVREYDAEEAKKKAKRILPDGLINWEVY